MKQHALRMPDELFDAVNAACGDVPRNTWILRAIEKALLRHGVPTLAELDAAETRRIKGERGTFAKDAVARQAKLNKEQKS